VTVMSGTAATTLVARDRGLLWHPYAPLDGSASYAVLAADGVRLTLECVRTACYSYSAATSERIDCAKRASAAGCSTWNTSTIKPFADVAISRSSAVSAQHGRLAGSSVIAYRVEYDRRLMWHNVANLMERERVKLASWRALDDATTETDAEKRSHRPRRDK
jgi:hypothetical protein